MEWVKDGPTILSAGTMSQGIQMTLHMRRCADPPVVRTPFVESVEKLTDLDLETGKVACPTSERRGN